jgi:hypothetical protein
MTMEEPTISAATTRPAARRLTVPSSWLPMCFKWVTQYGSQAGRDERYAADATDRVVSLR